MTIEVQSANQNTGKVNDHEDGRGWVFPETAKALVANTLEVMTTFGECVQEIPGAVGTLFVNMRESLELARLNRNEDRPYKSTGFGREKYCNKRVTDPFSEKEANISQWIVREDGKTYSRM